MLPLAIVQLLGLHAAHPGLCESRLKFRKIDAVLLVGERVHPFANGPQLFRRGQPVRVGTRLPFGQQQLQAADAHHRELVQVRRRDREELEPFEQRDRRIAGLIQHPLIELQPTQFTIEETRFRSHAGTTSKWKRFEGARPGKCSRRARRVEAAGEAKWRETKSWRTE